MANKYKIVRGKTGKSKKVIVAGVKKVLYLKEGSRKLYVISKGRMMNLTKYKKMKKMAMKSPKKSSSKKTSPKRSSSKKRKVVRKKRRGGGGSLIDY
tara:strand:- start:61 stop:351 length:291 start_codon:yes stop_codon:yes gene_type:complete